MKFVKGIIMGGVITASGIMLYNEMPGSTKRRFMKKGKQLAKKMGIM